MHYAFEETAATILSLDGAPIHMAVTVARHTRLPQKAHLNGSAARFSWSNSQPQCTSRTHWSTNMCPRPSRTSRGIGYDLICLQVPLSIRRLRVSFFGWPPQDIHLHEGTFVVGRSDSSASICIPHERISRAHAELEISPTRCTIRDLQSTNGTRVNGTPITFASLRPGDRITIGHTPDLVIQFLDDPVPSTPQ